MDSEALEVQPDTRGETEVQSSSYRLGEEEGESDGDEDELKVKAVDVSNDPAKRGNQMPEEDTSRERGILFGNETKEGALEEEEEHDETYDSRSENKGGL